LSEVSASPFVSTPLMALDQALVPTRARGATEPPPQIPGGAHRYARFRRSRSSSILESAPSRMRVEECGLPFVFPPWTGGGGFGGFTTYRDDIVPGPSSQPMERARHLSSEMDLVRYGAAQKEKEDVDMREEKDEHRVPVTGRIASESKGKKRAMSKEPSDKENEKDEGDGANSA
jgi:hypothetical protein